MELPSAKKTIQKSSNMPYGNMPDKLSQNEGADGAFVGRAQPKSSEDIVLGSSGGVNGHKNNSDMDRRRASSLSPDSPNMDATWEDITGEAINGNIV